MYLSFHEQSRREIIHISRKYVEIEAKHVKKWIMLCELAHNFPPFVENFLERGRSLRRRFREESVTDLLMNSLLMMGGRNVIVEFPDEPVTGADMEWNFVNPDDNTFFRILLQAKQSYGDGKVWTRHTYKELLHAPRSGTALQAVTLCMTARHMRATYPLYIFYHPEPTCSMARAAGFPNVAGASLADGYEIERLAVASTTRSLRTRNKSVGRIAPLLFPLSDIFCPPTILPLGPMAFAAPGFAMPVYLGRVERELVLGRPIPSTPHQIRDRLAASKAAQSGHADEFAEAWPSVPPVAEQIPDNILRIMEEHSGALRKVPGLRRWRVTFVSQNPPDWETELERLKRD